MQLSRKGLIFGRVKNNKCPEWFTSDEDGEANMKHHAEEKPDAFLPSEMDLAAGKFHEEPATIDMAFVSHKLLVSSTDREICTDYSEEAIPERDPAYQLGHGTYSETQTIEHLPAARRLALARCLEELGMSATRAALMASL
jgi:hypothetical protein